MMAPTQFVIAASEKKSSSDEAPGAAWETTENCEKAKTDNVTPANVDNVKPTDLANFMEPHVKTEINYSGIVHQRS